MLTRLKVNGFKNLVDVDVRFGPFTCIAGANGVGKSNLFDAIRFLSALADMPLVEAALQVRGSNGRESGIRNLFYHTGDHYVDRMTFEADMIIPRHGQDDLGQQLTQNMTALRYRLVIAYNAGAYSSGFNGGFQRSRLEVVSEDLVALSEAEAKDTLLFPGLSDEWKKDFINIGTGYPVIETKEIENQKRQFFMYFPDGELADIQISPVSRTLLSTVNTVSLPIEDTNTAGLLARREMRSWQVFQFEPSAARGIEERSPLNLHIGERGENLTSVLYRIARSSGDPERVYVTISNRLGQLVDGIRFVRVDVDEAREELILRLTDTSGTTHTARSLSDGTLRFLALAIMELDPSATGVLCLEEPENGLNPSRLPAMLRLLQDIAVDPRYPVDSDNPMRQVIINTYSPSVIQQVPDDSLLLATQYTRIQNKQGFQRAAFECLPNTWRAAAGMPTAALGDLITYLNPVPYHSDEPNRLVDRADLKPLLPWSER